MFSQFGPNLLSSEVAWVILSLVMDPILYYAGFQIRANEVRFSTKFKVGATERYLRHAAPPGCEQAELICYIVSGTQIYQLILVKLR